MNVRITKVTMDRWPNKEDLDKYKSSKKILDVNFCVDIDELISSSNVTDKSQSAKNKAGHLQCMNVRISKVTTDTTGQTYMHE